MAAFNDSGKRSRCPITLILTPSFLNVSDNSGRNSTRTWTFALDTTPALSLMVNSPLNQIYNNNY